MTLKSIEALSVFSDWCQNKLALGCAPRGRPGTFRSIAVTPLQLELFVLSLHMTVSFHTSVLLCVL